VGYSVLLLGLKMLQKQKALHIFRGLVEKHRIWDTGKKDHTLCLRTRLKIYGFATGGTDNRQKKPTDSAQPKQTRVNRKKRGKDVKKRPGNP